MYFLFQGPIYSIITDTNVTAIKVDNTTKIGMWNLVCSIISTILLRIGMILPVINLVTIVALIFVTSISFEIIVWKLSNTIAGTTKSQFYSRRHTLCLKSTSTIGILMSTVMYDVSSWSPPSWNPLPSLMIFCSDLHCKSALQILQIMLGWQNRILFYCINLPLLLIFCSSFKNLLFCNLQSANSTRVKLWCNLQQIQIHFNFLASIPLSLTS